jgi:hypothetical protein
MSVKRRRFGRIRRLPSGRFQARYQLGDGRLRSAPTTLATEAEADRYLATVETDLARGTWFDPDAGEIRLDDCPPRWLTERPVELQPRTAEIYRHLLRRHIYPTFGASPLNRITSAAVRSWNAALRESDRCRRCDRSTMGKRERRRCREAVSLAPSPAPVPKAVPHGRRAASTRPTARPARAGDDVGDRSVGPSRRWVAADRNHPRSQSPSSRGKHG